jgi:molecular chaperone GrpE
LARTQSRPGSIAFAPASKPLIASRWYATEPESKDKAGETATAEGNGKEVEDGAEDPAKKELDAKNREVIDLKV